MIALNFSRAELELLVKAIETAWLTGWPTGDDVIKVQVFRQQLEKAIANLLAQGWQGFNKE